MFAVKTKMGKERDVSTKQNFPWCLSVHRGGKRKESGVHQGVVRLDGAKKKKKKRGWDDGGGQRVVLPGDARPIRRIRLVSRAIMSFVWVGWGGVGSHVAHV